MKSHRVNAEQMRNIYLLLGECQELGDDLVQWRSHLWMGIAKLLDADLILHAAISGKIGAANMRCGGAWGFENGFNAQGWLSVVQEYGGTLQSESTEIMMQRVQTVKNGCVASRQMMITNDQWSSTFDKTVIADTIGTSAAIQSYFWLPGEYKELDVCTLTRGVGRPQFVEREVEIMRLLHGEVTKLVGNRLAGYDDPRPGALPPRVRQVLRCMLEGDSDKQIAARLEISSHTVNQYTKLIYQHFSVKGRAELLARWIKRGWGINSGTWETPPGVLNFVA
jgi:DNA-binding NarL/FixJ family response regulator